jgi:hypothetical protein
MVDLHWTNILLGIIAGVSVFGALCVIGVGVAGFIVYSRVMHIISELETKQIAPLREKIDAILVDVKAITARVSQQTERVDQAINGTIDRVDETAHRVRSGVREKVNQVVGVVVGVRSIIMSMLRRESHA